MGDRFKLAYIGAGSFRFSTGFFRNIVNATEFMPMEVALCDIDGKNLDLMSRIFKKMVIKAAKKRNYAESDILVSSSTDQKVVLENADFVYKSISVGMQKSEWFDIYLPIKFGIPQNTGDTVGPGGLFRNLRTDPACASIAVDMKKLCPKAPLLNYTNPNSCCTLAARTAAPDVQFIGLCHELFGGMKVIKKFYNTRAGKKIPKWQDMDLEYTGVNHFAWLTKIGYKGEDLYPILREKAHLMVMEKFHGMDAANAFNFHLCEKYGYFPYVGARHTAEFLPEYYNYFNYQKENQCPYWNFPVIRSVSRVNTERHLAYFWFRNMVRGVFPVPGPKKEGELAMEMTLDWRKDVPTHYVVNVPNSGVVPELPDDSIVEMTGYWKKGDMTPVKDIHVTKEIAQLLIPHCKQQRYTVDAALGNSYDLVLKAMKHEPMCAFIEDDEKIEALTKLMLYYQQEWLPTAWKEWIPKKTAIEQLKYFVDVKELAKENQAFLKIKFPVDEKLRSKAFFWKE